MTATGEALTAREVQVLRLTADGLSNLAIAGRLDLTEDTIKSHLARATRKLGALNRVNAVTLALRTGLLDAGRPVAAPTIVPPPTPVPGLPWDVADELIAVAQQVLAGKPSASIRGQAGRALEAVRRRSPGGRVVAGARR